MDRQAQFRARELQIFDTAEQLLLESGESGMTLDALAERLDLAKGTLYKHFQSKDELYMHLIIRNEQELLTLTESVSQDGMPTQVMRYMLHHLHHPQRTVLLHQIEERLSAGSTDLNTLFQQLYDIRRSRLRMVIPIMTDYLRQINSRLTPRDYLAGLWAIANGGAAILNSTFYQRYLGDRDELRLTLVDQALALPFAERGFASQSDELVI